LNIRVSVAIPNELLRSIDELARIKKINRSILLSESVKLGAREVRIRFAIEQYQRGFMSVGRASEIAEVGLAEFLEEMRKRGVTVRHSLDSLIKGQSEE
jgi:predicted HTH domain antitoxin